MYTVWYKKNSGSKKRVLDVSSKTIQFQLTHGYCKPPVEEYACGLYFNSWLVVLHWSSTRAKKYIKIYEPSVHCCGSAWKNNNYSMMLLQHRSFIWKVSWKLKTGMHRKSPVLRITLELDFAFSPARNSYTNATRSARCLDPPANLQICDRKGEDELGNQCRGRILTGHRALARIRCPWWENRVREQSSSPWSSQPLWNHLRDRHRYHRKVATIVTNKWGRLTSCPLL